MNKWIEKLIGKKKYLNNVRLNSDKAHRKISENIKYCPICGHRNFVLDKNLVSPMNISEDNSCLEQLLMPLVTVVCENCGYVMFLIQKLWGV